MAGPCPAPVEQPSAGPSGATASRGRVVPVATSAGRPVCESCLVADTVGLRMRGLLGRRDLPAGEGVWIRPTNSIHMFFMRFSLDAVFLDRDDTIVKLVPSLRPWRMASCRGARSVIELAEGEIDRRGLNVGDRLQPVGPDGD